MPEGDPTPTPDPAPSPEPTQEAARTFTQEEVNKIMQDRLARAKREVPDDYAEAKAALAWKAEREAAEMSEMDRLKKEQKELEKKASAAEKRANDRLIQAEILRAATLAKALKPEHMHRLIDTDSVTVGDDGQVTGVEDAVKEFLEANPEYVGKGRVADPVDQGARGSTPGQLSREDLKSMSPEEITTAQDEGRLNGLLGING